MIHCLASAKLCLGKKSPRLGPKPCRGTSIFSISPMCSKNFKYWQINNMNLWWVKIFDQSGEFFLDFVLLEIS